jgi:prolyl oligopeptidase
MKPAATHAGRRVGLTLAFALTVAGAALAGAASVSPPATPEHDVTDTYHDRVIHDPYRWLEPADAPAVKQWIAAQNNYTESVLAGYPGRTAIAERVGKLALTSTRRRDPKLSGTTLFYLRQTPPQPQPVLVAEPWPEGAARVLVDTNSSNGDTAITAFWPSPDGRRLAYGTATGGDENTTIHFVDVATGKVAADALPYAGGGTTTETLAWDADGAGVTYARLPLPGSVPAARQQFDAALYHHAFGTPASADSAVLGRGLSPIAEFKLLSSESGALAAALVHYGDGSAEHVYLRRGQEWREVLGPEAKVMDSSSSADAAWDGEELLLLSHQNAPRGKLIGIDASGKSRVLVPEQDWAMNGVAPVKDGYLIAEVSGPDWRVRHYGANGRMRRVVPLPAGIGIEALASSGGSAQALIEYEGWSIPPRWVRYETTSGAVTTVFETKAAADYGAVRSHRVDARSADGTRVPVSVLALEGVTPNGNRPTVLTGYGGYGLASAPHFLGSWLAWLERGGVVAVAYLRGGSEYGEGWHEAGRLGQKQHVFDDFHAAAQALTASRWTDATHLGIEGGSNGGLLMGAALTQHPADYRAVVSFVGIYDMLRSELWPNGEYNIPEFGTVAKADDFAWLAAYSPLLHVKAGTAYPAVLLITGENDPRVAPWQSRKFAAALQHATDSSRPILLLTRSNEGHGVTSSFSQRVGNTGVMLAFFAQQLGLPEAAPAGN